MGQRKSKKFQSKAVTKKKALATTERAQTNPTPPTDEKQPQIQPRVGFTLKYLRPFLRNHPLSRVAITSFFGCFVASLVLTALAIHGLFAKQAQALIGENLGPTTLEFIGSIALILLTGRVAFFGPITNRESRFSKLAAHLSSTALGICAAYVGIGWGVSIALHLFLPKLPEPFTFTQLYGVCAALSAVFLWLFSLFVFMTVNPSVAPGYGRSHFLRIMRIGAAILCLLMIGRTALRLAMAFFDQ